MKGFRFLFLPVITYSSLKLTCFFPTNLFSKYIKFAKTQAETAKSSLLPSFRIFVEVFRISHRHAYSLLYIFRHFPVEFLIKYLKIANHCPNLPCLLSFVTIKIFWSLLVLVITFPKLHGKTDVQKKFLTKKSCFIKTTYIATTEINSNISVRGKFFCQNLL